jgi:hypothetical protein
MHPLSCPLRSHFLCLRTANYLLLKTKNNQPLFNNSTDCEKYAKQIELYSYNKASKANTPQLYSETILELKPLLYFVSISFSPLNHQIDLPFPALLLVVS